MRLEVALAGDDDAERRVVALQEGRGVDEILEALLLDQASEGEDERDVVGDAKRCPTLGPCGADRA